MATYVTGSISDFVSEKDFIVPGTQTTFVCKGHGDIWHLKSVLSKCGVDLAAINFLTAEELRENLLAAFAVPKKICTAGMFSLLFDEIAEKTKTDDPVANALIASKNSAIEAFLEILSSGVEIDEILPKALVSFFGDIRREAAKCDFIFESDCDRLLLELCDSGTVAFGERVIFHGFLPCDGAKVLMEVAVKCFAHADTVAHDLGDGEFVHLWIATLEKIFGECEFYLDQDQPCGEPNGPVFKVYGTIADEVSGTFGEILKILAENSSADICLCFGDDRSVYLPMFLDKLEGAGIAYCDHMGRPVGKKPHEVMVALWAQWQMKRNCDSFCRFCAELAANGSIGGNEFEKIIGDVMHLQGKCLSNNYDILLEFANLKNVHSFDIVEKYDIHGEKFSLGNFCKKFIGAFGDILPANASDALEKQMAHGHSEKIFFKKNLVKYFTKFVTFGERSFAANGNGNVTLLTVNDAAKRSFSHAFVVGVDAKNFDISDGNFWLGDGTIEKINGGATVENFGDVTIRSSHNYLLPSAQRKYLQRATFAILANRGNLCLSFAKKNHCNGATEQLPAKIFASMFYQSCGEFYAPEVEEKLLHGYDGTAFRQFYCTRDDLSPDDRESIKNCADSYGARHNLPLRLHDYCFGIDKKVGPKFSSKALEYLLKNPHIGFYDSVLRLPPMPWQIPAVDKRVAIGSFTHEFLQIFGTGNSFMGKTSPEIFHGNIDGRVRRLKALMGKACAAADATVPADFNGTVNLAAILAKRLATRLFSIPHWQSFRSEYTLPKDLAVAVCGEEMKLSGRLDFLISSAAAGDDTKFQSDVTIIDFKTGNDFELTEKNVKWHMERYESLQLLLYGLALKTLGFANVKILILKPDSAPSNVAISIDYVIDRAREPMAKLAKTIASGLVERQVFGKTFRQYFIGNLPTATTDLY